MSGSRNQDEIIHGSSAESSTDNVQSQKINKTLNIAEQHRNLQSDAGHNITSNVASLPSSSTSTSMAASSLGDRLQHPSLPSKPVVDAGGKEGSGNYTRRGRGFFASGQGDINKTNDMRSHSPVPDTNDGQSRRSLASRLSGFDPSDALRSGRSGIGSGTDAVVERGTRDLPLPPHLPPRPRDRYESPPPRSDPHRASSPPRRERDGRDTYRPHDTYRPGQGPDDMNQRSRRGDNFDRDLGRDRTRADGGYHDDTIMHFRDGHQGKVRDSSRGNANYLLDLPMPPPQHSMPPFRPTMPSGGGGGNNTIAPPSGPANLEQRRQLRESTQVNIWPESPKRSYAELISEEEKGKAPRRSGKKSKSSRRRRKYTSETESDSEEEYERERRRRKRRQREREKDEDEGRDKRRRRTVDSEDERERDRRRDKDRERERGGERSRRHTPDSDRDVRRRHHERAGSASPSRPEPEAAPRDEGPEVGPQLPVTHDIKLDREAYRDLLPGEGAAMQAFLDKGQRIPRRGEIGMDQDKIAALEGSGYVMSGSRHVRMNAVRLRKEGQVISADEKRAMLLQQREDWIEKEGAIISQFKEMMDERLMLEEKKERERGDAKPSDEKDRKGKRRE